jgi:hypothetical protein
VEAKEMSKSSPAQGHRGHEYVTHHCPTHEDGLELWKPKSFPIEMVVAGNRLDNAQALHGLEGNAVREAQIAQAGLAAALYACCVECFIRKLDPA